MPVVMFLICRQLTGGLTSAMDSDFCFVLNIPFCVKNQLSARDDQWSLEANIAGDGIIFDMCSVV